MHYNVSERKPLTVIYNLFNRVIGKVLNDILEKTPLNSDYMDVSKELARINAEKQAKNAKEVETLVEESEYSIEELGDEILDDGVVGDLVEENSEDTLEGVIEEQVEEVDNQ